MPKIIAEIGSNWLTDRDAVKSVELAQKAGADIVKFQTFTERSLYGSREEGRIRQQPNVDLLAHTANENGLEFMCTAFSAKDVDFLNIYVERHKIASAEMEDVDILDAVKASGKPIILSTGGHTLAEVHRVLRHLGSAADRTTLMYCESAYPTHRTMPEKLGLLMRETGLPVGISDHSKEIYLTAWLADYFDVPYLEKHVNLAGVEGTPDAPHSLGYEDLREMCAYIKNTRYDVTDLLSPDEADMRTTHNRRLVTTCTVPKGATLAKGINFGFYRGVYENAHGISPLDWERVNGRTATRDLFALNAISDGDFA